MKKSSLLSLMLLFGIAGVILTYTVIIPKAMESQVDSMKNYLKHEGYSNPQVVKINGFTKTAEFKDGNKTVSVRFYHGMYQIIY